MLNWIISFLTCHSQVIKCGKSISLPLHINCSIIQGSGVGPTLYIIMESDLKTLSSHNLFCNHADDTNLLVPGNSAVGINEEFINIKNWASATKMIISLSKTKEIVFR